MASANEPAALKIVVEDPQGNQQVAWEGRSDSFINAGKSPDGVLANLTVDKQGVIPLGKPIAFPDYVIRLFAKLDAADGLDVSDGVIQICVTQSNGVERQLNATDISYTTDYPAATVAGTWLEMGKGYTVPAGQKLRVGSITGKTPSVISIEDDTA